MTYRELLERLQQATPEQLANEVTIFDAHYLEFYDAELKIMKKEGVLPKGHLYINMME